MNRNGDREPETKVTMSHTKLAVIQTFILMFLQYPNNSSGLAPLVETDLGLIKGVEASDGAYSMFLGIPYAKVDLNNPFGPALPYPDFNETYEAYDDSVRCPQFDTLNFIGIGNLDCLRLNIHVPNSANSQNLLPVMVFIHGGGFTTGFGGKDIYGPKFLVRHDVVFVTLNYRLGVYGFMCLGTPEVPGNQGLKDQLVALRWVNKNIKQFGGDPDRVTIFGQSAGARSVDFHLMADDENLFSKAILQSGNSVSAPSIAEVNTELPVALAKIFRFETNDFREAVTFLKTLDPTLLASAATILPGIRFQACVENEIDGVDAYISDFTINKKVPKVSTTPILTGFTDNERYFVHASRDNSYYENLDFFGEFLKVYFSFEDNELANFEKLVRTFYIGDEKISVNVKQELADFDSDFTYNHPIHRGVTKYISNGANKIYYYMFSYIGERNYLRNLFNVTVSGAIHGDEIGYIFDVQRFNKTPSPADQLMIDRMTTMWTNFAKYGDPTPEDSNLLPEKWEPITDSNWNYYSIDSELRLKQRPFNRRMTFLDLFFEMNHSRQRGLRI